MDITISMKIVFLLINLNSEDFLISYMYSLILNKETVSKVTILSFRALLLIAYYSDIECLM